MTHTLHLLLMRQMSQMPGSSRTFWGQGKHHSPKTYQDSSLSNLLLKETPTNRSSGSYSELTWASSNSLQTKRFTFNQLPLAIWVGNLVAAKKTVIAPNVNWWCRAKWRIDLYVSTGRMGSLSWNWREYFLGNVTLREANSKRPWK